MKKKFIVALISSMCVALPAFAACGDSEITLKEWTAPVYSAYQAGNVVYISDVTAYDESGKGYDAVVSVTAPDGSTVDAAAGFFRADQEGIYILIYQVKVGDKSYSKIATVNVGNVSGNNQGGNGGNSGNQGGNGGNSGNQGGNGGGQVSNVLGSLKVIEGSEDCFSVSGNTVTVKKTSTFSQYKSVGYTLTGWTLANGENISFTVNNSTNGNLKIKYKVVADGNEYFGYPDLDIAAGGSDTYEGFTGSYDNQTPSSVSQIEFFVETTGTGTFTLNASLSGKGGSSGGSQGGNSGGQTTNALGSLSVVAGSEQSFSVSGNTVSIKKAVEMSSYQSVGYALTGWSATAHKYVKVEVKNNTSGTVGIKYKAIVDGEEKYGDYDLTIAAGETKAYTATTATYSAQSAKNVSEIQLFISSTATGNITITTSLGSTEFTGGGNGGNGGGQTEPVSKKPADVDQHTYDVLGDLTHVAGSDGYYTVSSDGTTVNVKRTSVIDNDFKAVGWKPTGYNKSNDKSIYFDIVNNTNGDITIKYKVVLSTNDDYYVDFEPIAAGESETLSTNIGGLEIPNPDGVKEIQLFIGNTAGSGTVKIVPRISAEEIPTVQAVKITQVKGGTVVSDKNTAEIGETVTLSVENADSDYEFVSFTVKDDNGDDVSLDGNTFTMVEGNVYVSATFNQIAFNVKITQVKGGTVSASNLKPEVGDTITLSVNLDADYSLVKYIVKDDKGNDVILDDNSFVMPESDVFVSAELFTEKVEPENSVINSYKAFENKLSVSGFTAGDSEITVNSTRDYGGSIYDAVGIVPSGMVGNDTVSFKVKNNSSNQLKLAVWGAEDSNDQYPTEYKISSVENGSKGQGSGKDVAEITLSANEEKVITIVFAKAADKSSSGLRFSPVYGGGFVGSFTVSEIAFS